MQNEWSVNEIFFSIDGEGKRSGSLAAFIRLAGCNLRCSYCDTAYAFTEGTPMRAEEIAEAVTKMKIMTEGERNSLGQNGKEWVIDNCDYSKLAKQFLKIMI